MVSIEQIMGPVGFLMASAMISTCIPVLKDIRKRQGVGEWSCFPYIVQQFNCYLWSTYTLAEDPTALIWVLACNLVGLAIAAVAFWFYIYYCTAEQRSKPLKQIAGVYVVMIAMGVYVFINRADPNVALGLGIVATGAAMIMYTGPAASLIHAVRERTTEFIPLALGAFTLSNASVWLAYAIAVDNIYIYACNLVGVVVPCIQIIAYVALTYACKKIISATTETTMNDSDVVSAPSMVIVNEMGDIVCVCQKDLENSDPCPTPETRSNSCPSITEGVDPIEQV